MPTLLPEIQFYILDTKYLCIGTFFSFVKLFKNQSFQAKDGDQFAKDSLTAENKFSRAPYYGSILNPFKIPKLACAGRLDARSEGLLIFSNDGKFCREIIGRQMTKFMAFLYDSVKVLQFN